MGEKRDKGDRKREKGRLRVDIEDERDGETVKE